MKLIKYTLAFSSYLRREKTHRFDNNQRAISVHCIFIYSKEFSVSNIGKKKTKPRTKQFSVIFSIHLNSFWDIFLWSILGFLPKFSFTDSTQTTMVSDSIVNVSIPVASSNPRDFAKKKRVTILLNLLFFFCAIF